MLVGRGRLHQPQPDLTVLSHRGTIRPPPVTSPITIPCTDSVIRSDSIFCGRKAASSAVKWWISNFTRRRLAFNKTLGLIHRSVSKGQWLFIQVSGLCCAIGDICTVSFTFLPAFPMALLPMALLPMFIAYHG